jgi:hypothetical protein
MTYAELACFPVGQITAAWWGVPFSMVVGYRFIVNGWTGGRVVGLAAAVVVARGARLHAGPPRPT